MPTTSHRAGARTRGRHARGPLTAAPEPLLEVVGVTAHAPNGRILLDDVTFSVQRGWLVAVVGPTGAGKTSLAQALTGGLALDAGTLRLDGRDLAAAGGRDGIGFVPQDDVLHGSLGLARTLEFAARLRVPASVGEAERRERVAAALEELGLQHHADVPVASLSGGQRKRANIAAELVRRPEVLVLDEPTSGLDPGYEKSVMTSLRQLADAGRTVIAVTHSMQSLQQCDRVLFLAEGGRVAYFGPPSRAADYFGQDDAADVFLALDTESGQAWKERFQAHPAYARYVTPVVRAAAAARAATEGLAPRPTPGPRPDAEDGHRWRHQVATLVRRQAALVRSDRRHLGLLALQGPLLGLLLLLVLKHDSLGLMPGTGALSPSGETVAMFVVLSATWLGASNTVREVVKERHIARREVAAGMRPSAYVAAKALVLGALAMGQSIVLALVAGLGQQVPGHGALLPGRLELALVAGLAGTCAAALGLLLSSAVSSPDKALAVLPMTLVAELVLAGSWAASISTPGVAALRAVTGAHWGVEATGASLGGDHAALGRHVLVFVLLTAAALVGAVALVERHTRPVDAVTRVHELRAAAEARAHAILGASAVGIVAIGLGTLAAGLAGSAGGPGGVVAATAPDDVAAAPAPAEQPAATTPAPEVPVTVEVPVTEAPATTRVAPPATTATTAPTPTAPPTTAAPTITTTVYTTPTTAATPPPATGVNAASSGAVPWWSPWYWVGLAFGG